MSALHQQEGGTHYTDLRVQPVEFIHANRLGYCEGAIIKYVSRYKAKNGKQDLLKARHFIDLLIELEYPDPATLRAKHKAQALAAGIPWEE